jgi:purine-binding chemotaxis protein CheW
VQLVREVVRAPAPRPVGPGAPFLLGVVALRGALLPVFDLAARLGFAAAPPAEPLLVVLETAGGPLAVLVDGVGGITSVAEDAVTPAPVRDAGVAGLVADGDAVLVVLAPDGLFALR